MLKVLAFFPLSCSRSDSLTPQPLALNGSGFAQTELTGVVFPLRLSFQTVNPNGLLLFAQSRTEVRVVPRSVLMWLCNKVYSFRLMPKAIPCGLVVRIRRSHRRGRGSIPRMGDLNFLFIQFFKLFFFSLKRRSDCLSRHLIVFSSLLQGQFTAHLSSLWEHRGHSVRWQQEKNSNLIPDLRVRHRAASHPLSLAVPSYPRADLRPRGDYKRPAVYRDSLCTELH